MKALGLADAQHRRRRQRGRPAQGHGQRARSCSISAHLDTVFPAGTDVKVKERDGKLYAPGISDDTRGLSVLLSWLKVLNDNKVQTVGDLLFVGNVGEEELGNLRGMKAIFRRAPRHRRHDRPGAGARRHGADPGHRQPALRGDLQGPGRPQLRGLRPGAERHPRHGPRDRQDRRHRDAGLPKTTFTVGTVGGGTSVNTISPDARMAVDIRSDEMGPLLETEKKVLAAVDEAVVEENKRWNVDTLSASHQADRRSARRPDGGRLGDRGGRSPRQRRLRPQDGALRRQHRRQRADVARHTGQRSKPLRGRQQRLAHAVARLDFIAQRRSLAIGGGGVACRGRATHLLARLDLDVGEPCAAQFLADQRDIVIAVRRAGEERGGSCGNTAATALVTSSAKAFSSMRSQTLKTKRPPGLSTRRASA